MPNPARPTDVAVPDDVAHQPALPTLELPEYHGRKPVGMKTSLVGVGTRITRPHSIGDRGVLVLEVRMKADGHEETDDGLVYSEKHKVLDLFELSGDQGARLLSTLRSLYRTGEEAAKGRDPLPELGDVAYADGSGVVLTPAEVAELRGDPVRAVLSSELTPAVIVYSDGARELWPDDFTRDAPRPHVGGAFTSKAGDVTVTKLLHHETGEELIDNVRVLHLTPDADAAKDEYSGDLGDSAAGWGNPDPATAARLAEAAESARIEALLPTAADFGLVDCDIDVLKRYAAKVVDVAEARRLVIAEEQGRGRALKPRKGALEVLRARVAQLEAGAAQ